MLSSQNGPRSSAQGAETWEQMYEKNQEALISGWEPGRERAYGKNCSYAHSLGI